MLDQLSPTAPARVRVVILPIGQIKRARFLSFVERLQPENVVLLGDVSPDGRPNRNMFSPLAFPTGKIVYDLTTHYPSVSYVALSPFELFREPLVVIAIADGTELDQSSSRGNPRISVNGSVSSRPERMLRELDQDLEDLRDGYSKAIVHRLLLFDYVHDKSVGTLPDGLVAVPPPELCVRTTMKTIMCDISSMLLAEMTTLAKSLQALSTIESPSVPQGGQGNAGNYWATEGDALSRRSSVYSIPGHASRASSPNPDADRAHARMSMPAQLRPGSSYANSPFPGSRTPATPNLPVTFDQLLGTPLPNGTRSQLATPNPNRDASRDRVSVQGFGPGSVSERSRNIGRGRVQIVVGSLYLSAGRWNDALKELVEGATVAKTNLDHVWHAKSLENILVSMIMLAWTGLDFQIPQICYASAEKTPQSATEANSPANNRLVSLLNLAGLLPELSERILGLYTRAASNTGESLPQLPFSETVIRMSKLLTALNLGGGTLSDDVLNHLATGAPLQKAPNLFAPRLNVIPLRSDIVKILFRAFPSSKTVEQLTVVDRTIVLGGIASVLGYMGYHRKKAMVIRELVSVLIPGLVQARLNGAAEMGVHPAAGLAALSSINGETTGAGALDLGEGEVESGVDSFLGLLSQVYGVVTSKPKSASTETLDDSDESAILRILNDASVRAFGGQTLKMDVLRSCINLSEALPDFHGVLNFTADLLRTAGSGVAPGPRSDDVSPAMSREEQVRLANNVSRTLNAARNLGVKDIAAEYWDEFLVRGLELESLPPSRTPIPHLSSELPGSTAVTSSRAQNPFIYNPFLRAPDAAAVERLLVAGESAFFKVTLQNPYEFDTEIEQIRLESEGVAFESATQKTVIGPYRTQILTISGTPTGSGQLKITGCIIKVRGCRERRFPIFSEPWSPQSETKIKAIGIASILRERPRPVSTESNSAASRPIPHSPKVATLSLNVIEKQPVVVVKSTSLSQSAVMILEGERQKFHVTLQNQSKSTPVDMILFSFRDSTQEPLKLAMSDRDISPAELYEMEIIFARKQALRWLPNANEKSYIAPGGTATFEIEVLGKPGLTNAVVQIDYAYLGTPPSDVKDKFHTRQVSLPITVTVNASIELSRMEFLPLTDSIPDCLWRTSDVGGTDKKDLTPEDFCLLLLDLRNAWPSQLHVRLEIGNDHVLDEDILPGNTTRMIFPVKRIYLPNPAASIPTLDPARQRQFVVSAGRLSADSERASREAFWYREEVLKILHGSWSMARGSPRQGEIELRGIRLSQRFVEVIKVDDVGIDILVDGTSGNKKCQLVTNKFSEVTVRVTNRSTESIFPLLRVQPSVRHQLHNVTLDLTKKFVWNGTLQQTLPILQPQASCEVSFGVTALCRGEFEISASVEEAKLLDTKEIEESTRQRANTRVLMDTLLGTKERRIWHSREPCLIVVRDGEESNEV